jgi:uncharacterized membrane protein
MYELGSFLIIVALAYLLAPIAALALAIGARRQVADLSLRLSRLERGLATRPHAAAAPVALPAEPVTPPAPVSRPPDVAPAPPPRPTAVPPTGPAPAAAQSQAQVYESFEQRFGTRWVVWIGGLALALGGVFLVSYAIEQGYFGPAVRTALGGLFAAALIAAGEWARRKDNLVGFGGLPGAYIPGILTAAGTTVAYATVYAAYALHGLIGPAPTFLLLGAVAVATLGAALLHGPALAGLGLVGAEVTPLLVATTHPNYWALYVFLTVVTAAAFALARARMWRWLAITTVAFGVAWVLPGLDMRLPDVLLPHLFQATAGFALACVFLVCGILLGPRPTAGEIDPVSSGALAAYVAGAMLVVLATDHPTVGLLVFSILAAATVAVAWRAESAAAAVPAAALCAILVMAQWALDLSAATLVAPSGPTAGAVPEPALTDAGTHLALGAFYAALFGVTGYLAQGRSNKPLVPLLWSAAAVLTPLAVLIALYWRVTAFERSVPFAALALLLAAVFATATETLTRRPPRPGLASAAALFASGTTAALALALTFALDRGWLTVGLALMAPGIAWVSLRRPLPMLRWLAAAIVALVLARIGWEPRIVGDDVGTTPIFNWLLYGYGVPAAAFWLAGHLLRRRGDDVPSRMVDAAAILFTVLLAVLQIRHAINGGDVFRFRTELAEIALQVSVGLALSIGLERIYLRSRSIVHAAGALAISAMALVAIVLGLLTTQNPMMTGRPVGGAFINLVLLGYAVPALLGAVLARIVRNHRPPPYRTVAAVTTIVLALAYLTLEVRTLYHGEILTAGLTTDAERYTYSAVWLAFGLVLLLIGIALGSQPARLASAAVVLLTVGKVFVLDLSDIAGIWRALSFIGLGLVLVGIGVLYQRLLFPPRARTT